MIGYLTGTIHAKFTGQIILLVGKVGYLVNLPSGKLNNLTISQPLELYIYSHIREDVFDLYGFSDQQELELFKMILTVSGIGPKTALLVIDKGAHLVEGAIVDADIDFFTNIPRLGKKNAQKIIIELKNKLGGLKDLELSQQGEESLEAVEALRSMGYTKQEAVKAIETVPVSEKTLEKKLSFALRQLGREKGAKVS